MSATVPSVACVASRSKARACGSGRAWRVNHSPAFASTTHRAAPYRSVGSFQRRRACVSAAGDEGDDVGAAPTSGQHRSTVPNDGATSRLPTYHVHEPIDSFDVIVVGAGHAGCEAALAACRRGARVLLLTLTLDKIAWQPCNPAVGGPAKSQLVHEIDALGGEMGIMADRCYLQKRTLNFSRGPAVWALRAQTDKWEYSRAMRTRLEQEPLLELREGMVTELLLGNNDDVRGVKTYFGMEFHAPSVVLTTGTFMSGQIWVGRETLPAGRAGEAPSLGLTENLVKLGFETGRLKTGAYWWFLKSRLPVRPDYG